VIFPDSILGLRSSIGHPGARPDHPACTVEDVADVVVVVVVVVVGGGGTRETLTGSEADALAPAFAVAVAVMSMT
jgi:hypothetical protein